MSWTSRTAATCASASGKSFWTHSVPTTLPTSSLWAASSGISEQLALRNYISLEVPWFEQNAQARRFFFLMRRKKCTQKNYLSFTLRPELCVFCAAAHPWRRKAHDAKKSFVYMDTVVEKMTCLKFNISSCCNPMIFPSAINKSYIYIEICWYIYINTVNTFRIPPPKCKRVVVSSWPSCCIYCEEIMSFGAQQVSHMETMFDNCFKLQKTQKKSDTWHLACFVKHDCSSALNVKYEEINVCNIQHEADLEKF